ncbi:MAG: CARDB domain-containing protein [Candidatus Limnocylindrales bacterium]
MIAALPEVPMHAIKALSTTLLMAVVCACASVPPSSTTGPTTNVAGGAPTVTIVSPANGVALPLGSDTAVLVSATDTVGVSRIDLASDGTVVATFTSPEANGQQSVSGELHWTPSILGAHTLSATAYRADGTASSPQTIAVLVVDNAGSTPAVPSSGEPTESSPATTPPSEPTPITLSTPTAIPTPTPTRRPRPTPTEAPAILDLGREVHTLTEGTDPQLGDYVDFIARVRNYGPDPARRFKVAVTCAGFTQEQIVPGLAAMTVAEIVYRFYRSVDGSPDNKSRIVIDSTNRIAETDEDNNVFDLYVSDPRCDWKP